jgi:hypothetical protein
MIARSFAVRNSVDSPQNNQQLRDQWRIIMFVLERTIFTILEHIPSPTSCIVDHLVAVAIPALAALRP